MNNDVWKGFDNFDNDLQQSIKPYLELPNLIFTGHSLGASVATIEYAKYCQNGNHGMLFAFGSPRVGNEQFIKKLFGGKTPEQIKKNAHFLFLSDNGETDPISLLPPTLPNFQDQFFEYIDMLQLTDKEKKSFFSTLTRLCLHSMKNYKDSLEAFLSNEIQ